MNNQKQAGAELGQAQLKLGLDMTKKPFPDPVQHLSPSWTLYTQVLLLLSLNNYPSYMQLVVAID